MVTKSNLMETSARGKRNDCKSQKLSLYTIKFFLTAKLWLIAVLKAAFFLLLLVLGGLLHFFGPKPSQLLSPPRPANAHAVAFECMALCKVILRELDLLNTLL